MLEVNCIQYEKDKKQHGKVSRGIRIWNLHTVKNSQGMDKYFDKDFIDTGWFEKVELLILLD